MGLILTVPLTFVFKGSPRSTKRNLYVPWFVIIYLSLKLTTNVYAVRLPDPDHGIVR